MKFRVTDLKTNSLLRFLTNFTKIERINSIQSCNLFFGNRGGIDPEAEAIAMTTADSALLTAVAA